MLVGVVVVPETVPGVLRISEKMGKTVAKQVFLQLYISLRVGVLGGGEVSKGGGNVVV